MYTATPSNHLVPTTSLVSLSPTTGAASQTGDAYVLTLSTGGVDHATPPWSNAAPLARGHTLDTDIRAAENEEDEVVDETAKTAGLMEEADDSAEEMEGDQLTTAGSIAATGARRQGMTAVKDGAVRRGTDGGMSKHPADRLDTPTTAGATSDSTASGAGGAALGEEGGEGPSNTDGPIIKITNEGTGEEELEASSLVSFRKDSFDSFGRQSSNSREPNIRQGGKHGRRKKSPSPPQKDDTGPCEKGKPE